MSGSASRNSSISPHNILPPIIANENDRKFLINLNSNIDKELSKVDKTNPTQRYIIYKSAFDHIIDYVSAYKPMLTAVKAEYEATIDTIQRGQQEAFFLAGKVKAMTSEHSTIHNYQKRAEDLDQKMGLIQADNARIEAKIQQLQALREQRNQQRLLSESEPPAPEKEEKDMRHIPGLTMKQSTDMASLGEELARVENQLSDLKLAQKTRYVPRRTKAHLKEQLDNKVVVRDDLAERTDVMKQRRQKLKIAVEAAESWMKIQPPVQTIGQAIVTALSRANRQGRLDESAQDEALHRSSPSTTFEDDDPGREKEAEIMLEYIEKFNELMEDELYKEAAVHAANSPKSILRTPETLNRFKDLGTEQSPSYLLCYCEALMSTVPAYQACPNEYMSLECVRCALQENKVNLLAHWIAQNRLTLTDEIGDAIFAWAKNNAHTSAVCLALAQQVYMSLNLHKAAAGCMVRQGRINQAVEYACQRDALSVQDYTTLLQVAPSAKLAMLLLERQLLPLGVVYGILEQAGVESIQVLQNLYLSGWKDGKQQTRLLRDLIFADKATSYELWEEIATRLQQSGYHDAAIEVLAAATVSNTMQHAAQHVHGIMPMHAL